jgi:hypothetical protein
LGEHALGWAASFRRLAAFGFFSTGRRRRASDFLRAFKDRGAGTLPRVDEITIRHFALETLRECRKSETNLRLLTASRLQNLSQDAVPAR